MIKWFDSAVMTGLPELTNTQGDLVKMLTGLLVNGANSKPVTTVSYANGVCTLTLGANHGFVRHSVIDLQGSLQDGFIGKEFRVKNLSVTTISFDCPIEVSAETGLTVRYAPLGWTQYFASEGKSCYQSPDPLYPAYLRVDDTKFSGTTATAAKFAGVEICADMTDFNTSSWQSPYDSNYPLKNRAFVSGISNGWFKWYYASAYSATPETTAAENGRRNYILCGDNRSFWLVLYPYVSTNSALESVVGMPLLTTKYGLQQCLLSTANEARPHMSFLNSSNSNIAPYLKSIGRAVTGFSSSVAGYYVDDILLQSPVFFKQSTSAGLLTGALEGIGVIPSRLADSNILKARGELFKVIDSKELGNSNSLNLGEY